MTPFKTEVQEMKYVYTNVYKISRESTTSPFTTNVQ